LTGFNGIVCLPLSNPACQRDFIEGTVTGSTSLGNATGTLKIEQTYHELNPAWPQQGLMTLAFNGTDSINVLVNWDNSTYPIVGGTGAYAGATGSLSVSNTHSGSTGYEFKGTGTVTVPGPTAPIITKVNMSYGSSTLISGNGWLEIHGTNLVPADTPATGVDWSNAPEFVSGKMPTRLGAIDSVTVAGVPAYIYFYCSAVTNPSCAGGDQINVLSPWYTPPGPNQIVVTRNGVASAQYAITEQSLSPAFPYFDAKGHVVARHVDGSLVGPATLFPGASTPAKAGETIILVAFGMGIPNNYVQGSAVQTFTLPQVRCFISGLFTSGPAGFISPGLVQLNVTIPPGTPSGENSIMCGAFDHPFSPGAMITVQGGEQIKNGSFESPVVPAWIEYVDSSSQARATFERTASTDHDGGYSEHVSVTTAGTLGNVALLQLGISVVQGTTYQLQFWAKSSNTRKLGAAISDNTDFHSYGLSTSFTLGTTDWQLYRATFQATETNSGRLQFYFGDQTGDVWLDGVSLQAVAGGGSTP
jgi:uncharacterized protein (TIGR03437 family)